MNINVTKFYMKYQVTTIILRFKNAIHVKNEHVYVTLYFWINIVCLDEMVLFFILICIFIN